MAEKPSIREQLIAHLQANGATPLADLYKAVPTKPETIRSILNTNTKKGKYFERTKKGEYQLRTTTPQKTVSVQSKDVFDTEKNPSVSLSAQDILKNKKIPKKEVL